MAEEKLTPIEAINEYYRLKDKYESNYYDKYIKPILKRDKSKREKRVEFSRLPKHECINCKRNVGTIFSITPDKNELLRKFIAKCGDLSDPCPLDIQINYSSREPFETIITSGLNDIELIKLNIIKEKNNTLFFKPENIVTIFDRLTSELKMSTEETGVAIETDILKNRNPVKISLLNKTIDEFGMSFNLPFKQMINDYIEKNDELILNQAIKFYIDEMIPKLKEIQSLRYEVNFVEYDENIGEYKLIQRANSIQNKEFCFENDDKVIKFIKGEKKTKNSKSTRSKVELVIEGEENNGSQKELVIKPKLKRLGNKLELIDATEALEPLSVQEEEAALEEEALEEEEGSSVPSIPVSILPIKFQVGELKETPEFEGENTVTWENPKYNDAWRKFPQNLKDILLTDHEWLEEFMNKCMNNKNNGKPCKLILPPKTILPPQLLENGQYDFGSNVVNRIFNKLNKSYKDTLLKLYSEKNGIKDYSMLKNTLEDLLEKELGSNFNKGYI